MFKFAAHRFFIVQIVSIAFVAALLVAKWSAAAESVDGCHAYEADCSERSLANGKPGETVRVCERVTLVCSNATPARQGTTLAWHARHGRLLAAR